MNTVIETKQMVKITINDTKNEISPEVRLSMLDACRHRGSFFTDGNRIVMICTADVAKLFRSQIGPLGLVEEVDT